MRLIRNFSLALSALTATTLPIFAGTTVSSPQNGAQVSSTFTLNMSADSCSNRPVTYVGYSLDNNTNTAAWRDHAINGPVGAPNGWHILHVKVWNDWGGICVTDVSVNVNGTTAAAAPADEARAWVPSYATSVSNIETLGNWIQVHDGGTQGSSSGWTGLTGSPAITGNARVFATNMWNYGGQRYAVHFGDDSSAHNFLYDTYVYVGGSADGVANLEFDLNQTMANGQTALMGFQCDGWTKTWDYTVNGGSPTSPWDTWQHSYAHCNPHEWGVNQWHHVQIMYSRNDSGWVTYKAVWLDNVRQDINQTVFSGFALGWGPALLTNFQVDGSSSGSTSSTIYMDSLTVYRW